MKSRIRLAQVLTFLTVLLLPALAFAQQVEGSDSGAFERYLSEHGSGFALIASFGAGFLASLTPCVFPMIPITVSIFGAKQADSRMRGAALSAVFVLGIATLFVPVGVMAALGGKSIGTAVLGKTWVLCSFAGLFIALAASMFGAFELALPQKLNNKLSSVGGGGFAGSFVLGLVMGLVAAPCTGPFMTGLITWIFRQANELGNTGQAVSLGAGSMLAFSLGLGVLFFVAGTFAVALPKAGAWMLGIKWVGGVVLAYMAIRYLGQAFPSFAKKLAHPGTTYGAVATLILAVGLALGATHIAAERRRSKIAHLSRPTKLASIVPAIVGAFMFATWISMPKSQIIPEAIAADAAHATGAAALNAPPIAWETSEADVLAKAQADKKPVLIDFGASWCPACMELEENTFPDARVRAEAARYVALKVDCSDDEADGPKALQKKYHVVGLPTVILIDGTGKESARFNEFVTPERFSVALRSVR